MWSTNFRGSSANYDVEFPGQGVCWRCGKAVICQAWFWHQGASGCRMCSKSHLRVDQLLEQEIPEDCLLLRLSQWFGSPCGCPERALTPRKRRWEHSVLYAGICGVSPSWKASDVESHRVGGDHTCARGLRSSPRSGKAAFAFHLENGKEWSSPGFSLSFWLSPCKGRARGSLQQKLLVLFLPQHHPLTLFSVSQLWCL